MSMSYARPQSYVRKHLPRIIQYIVLSTILISILIPLVILVFGSLKTTGEMYSHPYSFPYPAHWDNIIGILSTPSFWGLLKNSLIVMVATTTGVIVCCSQAAFVFARMDFRGKEFWFNLLTVGLMLPINVEILPVYFVLRQLDQWASR